MPSVRPSVNCHTTFSKTFSKIAWSIEAKFYVEPSREGATYDYINVPGNMTKKACQYMVKTFKILLLRTLFPMILKLGMEYGGSQSLQNILNNDSGLTVTHFTARLNLVTCLSQVHQYICINSFWSCADRYVGRFQIWLSVF